MTETCERPATVSRPTGRRAAVLHLMSRGLIDRAIARRLGVNIRTVERDVNGMMADLGARNRFAAGLLAVEQGWL